MFGLFQRKEPQAALPAVIDPEVVPKQQKQYLDKVLGESRSVLDADVKGFDVLAAENGWQVYCKPVQGTELTMARLEADVPMKADDLFKLLRTIQGKRIIDPFPRERHAEPVKALKVPKGEASIVYSEAPRFHGLLRPREYVTCDVAAPKERMFVCKSVKVDEGPYAKTAKGRVRANLLFAMRMKEVEGRPGTCHLQMINWLDLGANTVPPLVANTVTERWYFQGVMRRLNKHLQQEGGAKQ